MFSSATEHHRQGDEHRHGGAGGEQRDSNLQSRRISGTVCDVAARGRRRHKLQRRFGYVHKIENGVLRRSGRNDRRWVPVWQNKKKKR